MIEKLPFFFESLRSAYQKGLDPIELIEEVYRRITRVNDPGIFINLREKEEVKHEAAKLSEKKVLNKSLWGIPFVIKDNIDVNGIPTTAACPAFAYTPKKDSFVVNKILTAGALLIGKTNLDQFATGLVGTRTPYTPPKNTFNKEIIPGGSSSGSAVAVAQGLASFALGTDTAGSGRVPAALNNIVGLKPTLGALSNSGVVPACRTLDTISTFALTVQDAYEVYEVAASYDRSDPFSKKITINQLNTKLPHFNVGVPNQNTRQFFGDIRQAKMFDDSLISIEMLGGKIYELDFEPFFQAAAMLYDGPWIAERHITVEKIIEENPAALHPVTRKVIENAPEFSATDTFQAQYRLQELTIQIKEILNDIDMLCVPSVPKYFTLEDLRADPIGLNTQLGTYTNFVNLLDLCAITVPTAMRQDNLPGSVTLIGKAGDDERIASVAASLQKHECAPLGAKDWKHPDLNLKTRITGPDEIEIAVVGAHMSGLPLNYQLTDIEGRFVKTTRTSENYHLYKLVGGPPFRPGLVRKTDGASIEIEIWVLPTSKIGILLKTVPSPLGLGTIFVEDGSQVNGFVCEAAAIVDAENITAYGGWRNYLNSKKLPID